MTQSNEELERQTPSAHPDTVLQSHIKRLNFLNYLPSLFLGVSLGIGILGFILCCVLSSVLAGFLIFVGAILVGFFGFILFRGLFSYLTLRIYYIQKQLEEQDKIIKD